jgi:hypothetical protein
MIRDIGLGGCGLVLPECPKARGRDPVPLAEGFGESLRAFEPSGSCARPERLDAGGLQTVHQPQHQRQLGADYHKVDRPLLCQGDDAVEIVHPQRHTLGYFRDPGIAWSAADACHGRRGSQRPAQRVLTAAGADDEDVHAMAPSPDELFK